MHYPRRRRTIVTQGFLSNHRIYIYIYIGRVGRIDIVTNGTIIPDDKTLESLDRFGDKLRVIISDYGRGISTKVEQVADKLKRLDKASIEIRRQNSEETYFGGWVDMGISAQSMNKGSDYARDIFKKCAYASKMKFCMSYVGGVLYPCSALRRLVELEVIPPSPHEVFDLFDEGYTDDEIRERINAVYSLDTLSACAYCNGLCDDSVRYVPAEQLTEEELKILRT